MGKLASLGVPVVVAALWMNMGPGRATPQHAGPFWSIDYRGSEPEALFTRRFEADGDSILVRTYVNGFFQKRDTFYRGVYRTRTEWEVGEVTGMTPDFDRADVDRLFPLRPGGFTRVRERFGASLLGTTLTGCGWTSLRVRSVRAMDAGGMRRTVADISFDHYLRTYSSSLRPPAPDRARSEASEEPRPGDWGPPARPARRGAAARADPDDPCSEGRGFEERHGPSGTLTVDVETGVPLQIVYDHPNSGESRQQVPIAYRFTHEDEAADIAAKAAMRQGAPRDPQTGLAYSPSFMQPQMKMGRD